MPAAAARTPRPSWTSLSSRYYLPSLERPLITASRRRRRGRIPSPAGSQGASSAQARRLAARHRTGPLRRHLIRRRSTSHCVLPDPVAPGRAVIAAKDERICGVPRSADRLHRTVSPRPARELRPTTRIRPRRWTRRCGAGSSTSVVRSTRLVLEARPRQRHPPTRAARPAKAGRRHPRTGARWSWSRCQPHRVYFPALSTLSGHVQEVWLVYPRSAAHLRPAARPGTGAVRPPGRPWSLRGLLRPNAAGRGRGTPRAVRRSRRTIP